MKKIFLVVAASFLFASVAFATETKWTAGWSLLGEPLNYKKSFVSWSVNPTTSKLRVTFKLVGATPNKLYQVSADFLCTTFPATFGQFPVFSNGGNCYAVTDQGVTVTMAEVQLGVVLTDLYGNGSFTVVVGPIAAGTYELEFGAMNGAGCHLIGGGGNGNCVKDFQSPGPILGDATTITIP
jgi:hypothetical protein